MAWLVTFLPTAPMVRIWHVLFEYSPGRQCKKDNDPLAIMCDVTAAFILLKNTIKDEKGKTATPWIPSVKLSKTELRRIRIHNRKIWLSWYGSINRTFCLLLAFALIRVTYVPLSHVAAKQEMGSVSLYQPRKSRQARFTTRRSFSVKKNWQCYYAMFIPFLWPLY